jgi:hypothetical protein
MIKYFIIQLSIWGLITSINFQTFAQSPCNSFSGNSVATISAPDSLYLTSENDRINIVTNITNYIGDFNFQLNLDSSIGAEGSNGRSDTILNSFNNVAIIIPIPLANYLGNHTYYLEITDGCNNTLTTNSINITVTKAPCIPIDNVSISDTILSTITLVGNNTNQSSYQVTSNVTINGGNFISIQLIKNNIPYGNALQNNYDPLSYVSYEIYYGTDSGNISYYYVFSNGCSSDTSNVLSINVEAIPFLPCTSAPIIYQFGLNGTVSDSAFVAQCSNQQLFLSVDELSTGPNDPNGRRFVYYQSGNVIGESYNNSFTINTSTTGTFSYSASAISNCGTTVSALRIVTIIPDSTSCDSSNNVGGNISCSIPTIMGNGNPLLTATIFGTVNYSASATTTDGNITSFTWYKTNYPQSLNDSTPLFGSSNSFTLLYATVSDTGSYAVTAQNSCGSTSTPFYFHISIDTIQPSGYVPVLPAVTSSLLGGDFTIPYTSPSFVLQVDSTGDTLSLQWANVVGVNTNAGDSYCQHLHCVKHNDSLLFGYICFVKDYNINLFAYNNQTI